MTAAKRISFKYWPIAIAVSLLAIGYLLKSFTDYLLDEEPAKTLGVLTDKQPHGVYWYRYRVGDDVFFGSDQRNRDLRGTAQYDAIQVGSQVTVYYVRNWPSISTLQTPPAFDGWRALTVGGVIVAWLWILKSTLIKTDERD
jgi:hypothetical protein